MTEFVRWLAGNPVTATGPLPSRGRALEQFFLLCLALECQTFGLTDCGLYGNTGTVFIQGNENRLRALVRFKHGKARITFAGEMKGTALRCLSFYYLRSYTWRQISHRRKELTSTNVCQTREKEYLELQVHFSRDFINHLAQAILSTLNIQGVDERALDETRTPPRHTLDDFPVRYQEFLQHVDRWRMDEAKRAVAANLGETDEGESDPSRG